MSTNDEARVIYLNHIKTFLNSHGLNWKIRTREYFMEYKIHITETLTLAITGFTHSLTHHPYAMYISVGDCIQIRYNKPELEKEKHIKMIIEAYIREDERFITETKEMHPREYKSTMSALETDCKDYCNKIISDLQALKDEGSQKIDWYKEVIKGLEYGRDKMATQYKELQFSQSQLLNDIEAYKSMIKYLENEKDQMSNTYIEYKKEVKEVLDKLSIRCEEHREIVGRFIDENKQLSTQCEKDKDLISGLMESVSIITNKNDELIQRVNELENNGPNYELTESLIDEITRLKHENTMMYDKYVKSKTRSKVYRKRYEKVSTQLEDEREKVDRLEKDIDILRVEVSEAEDQKNKYKDIVNDIESFVSIEN